MKVKNAVISITLFTSISLLAYCSTISARAQGPGKSKVDVKNRAGETQVQPATPVDQNITLVRNRDYHHVSGNIGCPACKDMYCSQVRTPSTNQKIISIEWKARRPVGNNHWYRCQAEVNCGVPEFSDPDDGRLDCHDKSACNVCRATDDGYGGYEDDIHMVSK